MGGSLIYSYESISSVFLVVVNGKRVDKKTIAIIVRLFFYTIDNNQEEFLKS